MPTESTVTRTQLVRALGPFLATAVVVGTVIGSGVFKKPQVVAQNVPYSSLAALVWVLGGLLALLGALALAEVAVLYPRAGGNYVFLRESYGRLAGFLWGWVELWIIRSASIAALASVFADSLCDVLGGLAPHSSLARSVSEVLAATWSRNGLTASVIVGLALVNARGVRWGGVLQLAITIIKIGSLLAIAALPFLVIALDAGAVKPETSNLLPLWPSSVNKSDAGRLGTALLGVLWAYHGWMNVAPVAGEVKNPQHNIPLALLGGIGIIIALYLGANLAYYLILPASEMASLKGSTVATAFCERLLGPWGMAAASAAVMMSVFGALNGNLLVGPRVLYAMSEDGLAPRFAGRVHARYHTPAWAILMLAAWSTLLVMAATALAAYRMPVFNVHGVVVDLNVPQDKPLFDIMTDFAMFGAIIFETLAVSSIFVFRWRLPNMNRPYRCPGYPVVPAIYVSLLLLVVVNTFLNQRAEAAVGVGFIAVGAIVYYFVSRGSIRGTSPGEIFPSRFSSPRD
jgi:basic amino acid/polyamine antiporter, APA family